jgi:hypothetical protein
VDESEIETHIIVNGGAGLRRGVWQGKKVEIQIATEGNFKVFSNIIITF